MTGLVAAVLALVMVQVLAHGMTYPLREMVSAARAMARGDYGATRHRHLARRGGRAGARVQRDGRRARRGGPDAQGPRRERLPRAPNPHQRAPGPAREPHRRGRARRALHAGDHAPAGRAARRARRAAAGALEARVGRGAARRATRIDLRPVVEQVLEESRPQAESRGVGLTLDGDAEVGLRADEHRLHQVVANLVSNAVRHSPEGGRVSVRIAGDDGKARLEVGDEGPGHPAGGGRARLRALLPLRPRAHGDRGRQRARARDRPLDRRAARRHDPRRAGRAARLPHGGRAAAMRWLALAAALCAAAFLPAGPPGVGVVLVAALIAAAAARGPPPGAAARSSSAGSRSRSRRSPPSATRGWVVAIDLRAAWLARVGRRAAGPQSSRSPRRSARLPSLPSVAPRAPGRLAPAFRGAFLGGFLVVPFAALFFAADAAFAELGGRDPASSDDSLPLRAA